MLFNANLLNPSSTSACWIRCWRLDWGNAADVGGGVLTSTPATKVARVMDRSSHGMAGGRGIVEDVFSDNTHTSKITAQLISCCG